MSKLNDRILIYEMYLHVRRNVLPKKKAKKKGKKAAKKKKRRR